ncbi:MAG: 50S ribosomal protein L29 [Deltaproteobacteria bacterium]|nr:50S ribosomal protein L29 [Deltaproteobacteria bacterium]
MEAKEIRALTKEEMDSKVVDLVETYFNLRFQHKTGQLENSSRLKQVRRDIARVKTIRRQNQQNII